MEASVRRQGSASIAAESRMGSRWINLALVQLPLALRANNYPAASDHWNAIGVACICREWT